MGTGGIAEILRAGRWSDLSVLTSFCRGFVRLGLSGPDMCGLGICRAEPQGIESMSIHLATTTVAIRRKIITTQPGEELLDALIRSGIVCAGMLVDGPLDPG